MKARAASLLASALFLLSVPAPARAEPSSSPNASSGLTARGALVIAHDVRPGPGVTASGWLSDYAPSLAGGPGDGRVYVLDSGRPGATLLVVGGTHANEIAGIAAATLVVERALPAEGRIVVVPNVNNSGAGYSDPANPRPSWIRMEAASGTRWLKYGARFIHPEHQGRPDPDRYTLPNSAETLPGEEQRNLDRAYPGKADGTLAERLAAAVVELIRREGVDIAIDMHEASPGSKNAWMIVANPKNLAVAVDAVFDLDERGIAMALDKSSEEFRGLSHREWGDCTGAQAFLVETVNPGQARTGGEVDQLRDPVFPLWKRVAVQLEAMAALVRCFDATSGAGLVRYAGLPGYAEFEARGLEPFF